MSNKGRDLQARTKAFALNVKQFVDALPTTKSSEVFGRQLLRAAASVGANYRAACRARSKADFINKLGMVEEEADECHYWLELFAAAPPINGGLLDVLLKEADELTAIIVASIRSAKRKILP